MTTIEERSAYLNNPFLTQPIYGNYSPFYVTIGVCATILAVIFVLNIVLGCCSRHKGYWQDRHTGNRWLVSIWSATPHQQPPLDLTELKDASVFQPFRVTAHKPSFNFKTNRINIFFSPFLSIWNTSLRKKRNRVATDAHSITTSSNTHRKNTWSCTSVKVTFEATKWCSW